MTAPSPVAIEALRAIVRQEVDRLLRERGYVVPEKGRAHRPEDAPKREGHIGPPRWATLLRRATYQEGRKTMTSPAYMCTACREPIMDSTLMVCPNCGVDFRKVGPTPVGPGAYAPPPAVPAAASPAMTAGFIGTLLGIGMLAIGCFLPWASASAGIFTVEKSGLQGDGLIVLVLAALALTIALVRLRTAPETSVKVVVALLSLAGAGLAGYDLVNLKSPDVILTPGAGIYLCVVGGVLAAFAAFGA